MDIQFIMKYLKKNLSEKKLKHSLNVALKAEKLAKRYGVNPREAYFAGLLHDIARDMDTEKLLDIARANNLIEHSIEEKMPVVLHANVGAFLISHELKITNKNIIQAVHRHTVAAPEMSNLDKIIYIADVIEPDRSFEGIEDLRKIAQKNLDEAFWRALDGSITYLINMKSLIHPFTIRARNKIIEGVK